jgi:hypothetical protein
VTARIQIGEDMEGSDLKTVRPFCVLSLDWKADAVKASLKAGAAFSESRRLAEQVSVV